MEITYLGNSSFRIKGKDITLVADPIKGVSVSDSPFIIQKPGEYEIKGATVLGFRTAGDNTSFLYELDGLRIFHLGNIIEKFADSQMDEIGEVDILFIAPGDKMQELIAQIEPKIVVLMGEENNQNAEVLPKLTISKLDLPTELKTIVLERKSG